MTCKERVAIECPDVIGNHHAGGVIGCPYDYSFLGQTILFCALNDQSKWMYTGDRCKDCWNQECKSTTPKPSDKKSNAIDIHSLIDDAMAKKDRYVSIFLGKDGVSVDIYPYECPEEMKK